MNLDLRKAEQALARGDRDEARVFAWNALANIEPQDLPSLLQIAQELDDRVLIREIERRGVPDSEPKREEAGLQWKGLLIPVAFAIFIAVGVGSQVLGEAGPVKPTLKDVTSQQQPALPPSILSSGVWIVQLGRSNRVPQQRLAADLSLRYGIPVGGVPTMADLPVSALDEKRDQLVGDVLLQVLQMRYPAAGTATIIGITDYPMFSKALGIEHPFMLRAPMHYGVISTAELGADLFSRWHGHTRYQRTRKLVARGIGVLYLLRAESNDPHSLLRSSMSGTDDIDALVEEL